MSKTTMIAILASAAALFAAPVSLNAEEAKPTITNDATVRPNGETAVTSWDDLVEGK